MLVFRDAKRLRQRAELERELEGLEGARGKDPLGALLLAAEVECALEDAKYPSAEGARRLTDALADAWLDPTAARAASVRYEPLALPSELHLKVPEGYAFYALDPRGYADVARSAVSGILPVCVIGVRSIGTSLSAIVRASLEPAGIPVRRVTVRPGGHPWDRQLTLDDSERTRLLDGAERTEFLIVDEGPGLSGSTLLAVSDALLAVGVPAENIRFLTSRAIEPERLRARAAAARFAPFRSLVARPGSPPEGAVDLSGGAWRAHARFRGAPPPCWALQERVKYLDPARELLHKFSGYAHYGEAVRHRAELLARVGHSPSALATQAGFLTYPWLSGRCAGVHDRTSVLRPITEYLAFRSRAFRVMAIHEAELLKMTELNVFESCNVDLPRGFALEVTCPVVPDGRMLPYEWVITREGALVKTDGAEHGDDHFFPGPADIAWDVAGVIVEWNLDLAEKSALLRWFDALTGDRIARRIGSYEIAYAAFRLGVVTFAASESNEDEARRFRRARARYHRRLQSALRALR